MSVIVENTILYILNVIFLEFLLKNPDEIFIPNERGCNFGKKKSKRKYKFPILLTFAIQLIIYHSIITGR